MKISIRAVALVTAVAGLAANAAPASAAASMADSAFVTGFAHAGANEIALAKEAMTKSTNPQVLAFAKKMVADHTEAGDMLVSVKPSGDPAPMTPSSEGAMMKQGLMAKSGAGFDAAYRADNIAGHTKAIAILQKEIASGTDPKLVAYAKKQLPIIEEHLTLAKALPTS